MATIASLSILVKGDSTQFEKTLTQAQKSLAKFAKNAEAGGRAMMAVGGAIVAPLALGVRQFMVEGDRIAKGAKRIAVSAEAYAGLAHAAELSGTSVEGVEKSIARLSRNLYDAGRGLSTAQDGFTDLGVKWEDLVGLSPDEQFLKVADALARETDDSKKLALAQVLLGRSAADLIPMINEGTDAIRANMAEGTRLTGITNAQAAVAEDLSDRWDEAKRAIGGVSMQMGVALAPALIAASQAGTKVSVWAAGFVREHPMLVKAAAVIGGGILGMGTALWTAGKAARLAKDALTGLKAVAPHVAAVSAKLYAMAAAAGAAKLALGGVALAGILLIGIAARRILKDITNLNDQIRATAAMDVDQRMRLPALKKRLQLQQMQMEGLKKERGEMGWMDWGAKKASAAEMTGLAEGIAKTNERIRALEQAGAMSGAAGGGGDGRAGETGREQLGELDDQTQLLKEQNELLRRIADKEGLQ